MIDDIKMLELVRKYGAEHLLCLNVINQFDQLGGTNFGRIEAQEPNKTPHIFCRFRR